MRTPIKHIKEETIILKRYFKQKILCKKSIQQNIKLITKTSKKQNINTTTSQRVLTSKINHSIIKLNSHILTFFNELFTIHSKPN